MISGGKEEASNDSSSTNPRPWRKQGYNDKIYELFYERYFLNNSEWLCPYKSNFIFQTYINWSVETGPCCLHDWICASLSGFFFWEVWTNHCKCGKVVLKLGRREHPGWWHLKQNFGLLKGGGLLDKFEGVSRARWMQHWFRDEAEVRMFPWGSSARLLGKIPPPSILLPWEACLDTAVRHGEVTSPGSTEKSGNRYVRNCKTRALWSTCPEISSHLSLVITYL